MLAGLTYGFVKVKYITTQRTLSIFNYSADLENSVVVVMTKLLHGDLAYSSALQC